jgi:S-(hydroxymethyl)glutathione dehydrogenase/alcohol dehydrogenase
MRIGYASAIGEFDVLDLVPRPLGAHDVRVEVGASGICASDHSALVGHLPFALPLVLGHELAGRVVEVGRAVTRVVVGDRVIGTSKPSCGQCWWCQRGITYNCDRTSAAWAEPRYDSPEGAGVNSFVGIGSFGDHSTVHEMCVVPVSTDLPDEQLALVGCAVITGAGAVFNTAKVTPGEDVAVIGCGGVGMAMIQAAELSGAVRIIAVDPVASKREKALKIGATDQIDPADGDVVDRIRDLTGGRGADVAFEAVGQTETITLAFQAARRAGKVVVAGAADSVAKLDIGCWELAASGKVLTSTLAGNANASRDFPKIVRYAEQGRFDLSQFVSKTIPLEAAAIRAAFDDKESVRVVIKP